VIDLFGSVNRSSSHSDVLSCSSSRCTLGLPEEETLWMSSDSSAGKIAASSRLILSLRAAQSLWTRISK